MCWKLSEQSMKKLSSASSSSSRDLECLWRRWQSHTKHSQTLTQIKLNVEKPNAFSFSHWNCLLEPRWNRLWKVKWALRERMSLEIIWFCNGNSAICKCIYILFCIVFNGNFWIATREREREREFERFSKCIQLINWNVMFCGNPFREVWKMSSCSFSLSLLLCFRYFIQLERKWTLPSIFESHVSEKCVACHGGNTLLASC